MTDLEAVASDLHAGRERFLALVADIRPDLHRYCARMTGSVSDGEDIVQETLARAYYALPEMHTMPPLRTWLFQIAHRRAIDHLRRYDRRMGRKLEDTAEPATREDDAESALAKQEAVQSAISRFLGLPPEQRSCVILKDVLDHPSEEIGALLGLSIPAVKAALHRGRTTLRSQSQRMPQGPRETSPEIERYAALFNARDWDGVRAMLAEDVRLDLVSRSQRAGRRAVSGYLTNYSTKSDWRFVPAFLEGREILAAFRNQNDAHPSYIVELEWVDGRIVSIKDFRYVPYIAVDAEIEFTHPSRVSDR